MLVSSAIFLFYTFGLNTKTSSPTIEKTRNYVNQITSSGSLKVVPYRQLRDDSIFWPYHTDLHKEATAYYLDKKLVKIREIVCYQSGSMVNKYYIKNDTLVFVEEVQTFCLTRECMSHITKKEIFFRGAYYISGKEIIKSTESGHEEYNEDGTSDIWFPWTNRAKFFSNQVKKYALALQAQFRNNR